MQLNECAERLGAFRLTPPSDLPGICGALLVDEGGTVHAISQELAARLPTSVGRTLDVRSSPGKELLALSKAAVACQTGSPDQVIEMPVPGSNRSEKLRVSAFPCARGTHQGLVLLLMRHDFADPDFQHALLQIDRLSSLGTVSASMAHEVKNALVAVKSFIDLLLEKDPNAELAGLVRRELARIEAMVSGTLRFAGPTSVEIGSFQLHTLVEHALNLVGPGIKTRGIQVSQTLEAAEDRMVGSSAQLQQACVNLLLNALEAMGQGGKLLVGSKNVQPSAAQAGSAPGGRHPGWIALTIADSGPGLTAEEQAKLFQPFFTTKPGGTGLGLAITRRIIEQHSGSITVRSNVGEGAVFVLTLPLAS